MPDYTIVRAAAPIEWDAVPALSISHAQWLPDAGVRASAQLCYDEETLYLRMTAAEAHIRAEEQPPVGMPCNDSCLEFFFCPAAGDDRYLNIEFSPSGCMFLGFGLGRADRMRLLPQYMAVTPVIESLPEGWRVTCAIPAALVRVFFPGFRFAAGMQMRANLYKCGDLTPAPHYLLWHPSTSDQPDFHRSQDFGVMTLG